MSGAEKEQGFALAVKYPTEGQPVELSGIPSGTEALRITFQPDARAAQIVSIVKPPAAELSSGTTSFTPEHAGIMRVEAVSGCKATECTDSLASLEASVTFDGVPTSGLVICLVAACLLFGGSAWALRLILRSE